MTGENPVAHHFFKISGKTSTDLRIAVSNGCIGISLLKKGTVDSMMYQNGTLIAGSGTLV
jgi:hypothetical protein